MSPQLARALAGQSLIFLLDLGAEWNDALIDETQSSPAAAPSTEPGAPEGSSGGGRQSGGLSGLIGGSAFGTAFGGISAERPVLAAGALAGAAAAADGAESQRQRLLREFAAAYPTALVLRSAEPTEDDAGELGEVCGVHLLPYKGRPGLTVTMDYLYRPALDACLAKLQLRLAEAQQVEVENNNFSLTVDYRGAQEEEESLALEAVSETVSDFPNLRFVETRSAYEIRPEVEWNRAKAAEWLVTTAIEQASLAEYLGILTCASRRNLGAISAGADALGDPDLHRRGSRVPRGGERLGRTRHHGHGRTCRRELLPTVSHMRAAQCQRVCLRVRETPPIHTQTRAR